MAVVVALQRGVRKIVQEVLPNAKVASLTEVMRPALGVDAVLCSECHALSSTDVKELGVASGYFVVCFDSFQDALPVQQLLTL